MPQNVTNWLNLHFNDRWIGRFGPIEWPARSCDLTVADFFLWGYLKDRVYRTPVNSTDELKRRIREEFERIPQWMIERAARSVQDRLEMVVQNNGGHIVTNAGMHCADQENPASVSSTTTPTTISPILQQLTTENFPQNPFYHRPNNGARYTSHHKHDELKK